MCYKASAPGSLMLLGEYAVLHDKPAIVCAIDKRITTIVRPRNDEQIMIESALGRHQTTQRHITLQAPFEFVLATLQAQANALPCGCDITIHADFASDIGLGSSAAVTVALLTALNQWLGKTPLNPAQLWQKARAIVLAVQGAGSGADLAASIYGGVVSFRKHPWQVSQLHPFPPICAIYSGKKTTTSKALDIVKRYSAHDPMRFTQLFTALEQTVQHAIIAIEQQDWPQLGRLFNDAHRQLEYIGVSNATLTEIIQLLRQQPGIFGAKISGAGLGDCAIGVGRIDAGIFPQHTHQRTLGVRHIPLALSAQGVMSDER